MRISVRLAALLPLILAAGFLGGQAAQASSPATLYVDQSSATCSDSGPGSQAIPFCTIQAAADVVTAGQTVAIEGGTNGVTADYRESVSIRNSGTPSAPITFTAVQDPPNPPAYLYPPSGPGFTLGHIHDVTISRLSVQHWGNADGVDVIGSQNVTLDGLYTNQDGAPTASPNGITIDGGSSGVTVSRSDISQGSTGGQHGIRVEPGAQQITLAANYILRGGIWVSGTSGAAITGNSVGGGCPGAIQIDGGSTAVVENNFAANAGGCSGSSAALFVAQDSASAVQADYNSFRAISPATEYSWGGTPYATAAAFSAGTGQGTHDIDQTTYWPGRITPPEDSPLIDSADCSAPGELGTDFNGNPRVDDPLVAGTGTCHADRGALERQDSLGLAYTASADPSQGAVPFTLGVTITSGATSPGWNEPVSYTADFGDGSGPAAATAGGTVTHTYTTPGVYTLTVRATDTGGSTQSMTRRVVAGTASPPPASLTAQPYTLDLQAGHSLAADMANFIVPASPDDWEVTSRSIAFGDGSSGGLGTPGSLAHVYPHPGTYTAALTVSDLLGRTSTASATITVGDEFSRVTPVKDYAATVPARTAVKLSMSALHAAYSAVDQAVLRVTVANPAASGSLTVYPDGATRPAAASVAFSRGQPASNLVLGQPGASQLVDFYNGSSGSVRLTVDTFGISGGQWLDTYEPVGPARVLDTRSGLGGRKGPVPAHGTVTFPVAGTHGVPANADAVVLDLTATGGKASGHLTAYPHGGTDPGTPDVSWATGRTRTGLVVVPVTDGSVTVRNGSSGTVNVLADLAGYYHLDGTGSVFLPSADRLASTAIAPRKALKVQVSGLPGIPASGITAVGVNLTASGATASGHLTGYPDGAVNPGTAALSFSAGQTGDAVTIVPVGTDGAIELYNASSGPVTVRLDLTGAYYQYPSVP